MLDPDGKQIAQYGGTGKAAGHFLTLGAIALDPQGNLWATERGGNRIQELNPMTGKGIAHVRRSAGTDAGPVRASQRDRHRLHGPADRLRHRRQPHPDVRSSSRHRRSTCAALPPVSSTPNIQVPTGPPDPAAQLTFTLVHRLGILRSGGFTANARCDQSCTLSVSGTLTPLGRRASTTSASWSSSGRSRGPCCRG